ncbi:hypothetical protein GCM10023221_36510 [Luteimicrobium xylanilyticum]|uniref:Uncharacterized protein n=1 Tax=Luteimicrobium xylanilyticum TaxID=1133546 RepID=A0A5P9Q8Y4_9MICO|nr:hypothetical protein [Luteimicrobium xylanilyticum]QFU97891.1 hypothetical protein KDY119_01397 [Luteimicrobium xylanilyticum]
MATPVPDDLLRIAQYVGLAEDAGYPLSERQLWTYAETPLPRRTTDLARLGIFGGRGALVDAVPYMRRVGWILTLEDGTVRLTALGRAVAKSGTTGVLAEAPAPVGLVILSPDDPLNLATLTRSIAGAGAGMLVDPYFQDDMFEWLMSSTSIDRVLLGRKATKLGSLPFIAGAAAKMGRGLSVRYLPPDRMHDRYLVAENGDLSMIGASLNGVHRNDTAIMRVPAPGAATIKRRLANLWDQAMPVEPKSSLTE